MDDSFRSIVDAATAEPEVARRFRQRLVRGSLSREENPSSHFCVYFGAHDAARRLVFVGKHKKSGLWLFNGGHIERGETPIEAVRREIGEEWGLALAEESIGPPRLLTITHTRRSGAVRCRVHYDIWYFVRVDSRAFAPDPKRLTAEFAEIRWLSPAETAERVTDANSQQAIRLLASEWMTTWQGGMGPR